MAWQSRKTWGHDVGLSCAFRQHRAGSHCSKLHGYALAITVVFEADELDERGWVIDFGGLKELKQRLVDTFDHKTLIAEDDPALWPLRAIAGSADVMDIVVLPAVGCEAFARHVWRTADLWLHSTEHADRVRIESVTVAEHGANSAVYRP
jgi:6-pyruvoyltetrahydropterin/6-carboxytetrahydropterin synthase